MSEADLDRAEYIVRHGGDAPPAQALEPFRAVHNCGWMYAFRCGCSICQTSKCNLCQPPVCTCEVDAFYRCQVHGANIRENAPAPDPVEKPPAQAYAGSPGGTCDTNKNPHGEGPYCDNWLRSTPATDEPEDKS